MEDFFNWLATVILGRIDGPMHFRLFLQPAMAMILRFEMKGPMPKKEKRHISGHCLPTRKIVESI